ncbi:MAG: glycine--tRNA ligase subunit beta [Sulfurovaceae bacterium]|nr:glycine--tRNA ligase subunit beta [Sulfurovaceae bacterium]
MTKPLLIEIGVEELPAIPLLKIIQNIKISWQNILQKYSLECNFEFYYTPRRLVLMHTDMPTTQANSIIELVGPPLNVAMKDGKPTPAGLGFAAKCGVSFDKLVTREEKGREVFFYSSIVEGKETVNLLEDMIKEWISSMAFGKMMRWANRSDEFIRPIRWLQVRLGDKNVPLSLYGVQSSNFTFVHRMVDTAGIEVPSIESYEDTLKNGAVILKPKNREALIVADFDDIERTHGVAIERDDDLLAEVVAITENPKALLGTFDEGFLRLPPEVIITSMKEHQRYFPVFKDGKLSNHFVVVSNAVTNDYTKVIEGNQRVLKPRLTDALFFYDNDLKRGLSIDGLEKVQFMDGLGSLKDKIDREEKIALYLVDKYSHKFDKKIDILKPLMSEAMRLAKADLTSEMVYEFTELQGLMGYYYAAALGKETEVCEAIKEQYMPVGEGAELPSSLFSAIVAMAVKLDTLLGLFSVGKIPTGSKDPFALRRAVNGIVRIVVKYDLPFDINNTILDLSSNYESFDLENLSSFIVERIYKSIDVNPSIITSVLASGERDICEIFKKTSALNSIVSRDDFKNISSTFKRVANISGDNSKTEVNTALFSQDEEKALYDEFTAVSNTSYGSYEEKLSALFGLKNSLDTYFDNVMVNSDDEVLKLNRQATIGAVYNSFKSIADIKEITI